MAWRFFTAGGVVQTGEYGELAANAVTSAKILDGTIVNADIAAATITNAKLATPGIVVQMVNTQTGAMTTGATQLPYDNSIPQNGEGDEYMTLAITPKNAANILVIEVVWFGSTNAPNNLSVALFVGSTAAALAATQVVIPTANYGATLPLTHKVTAGVTTGLTFKVRAGGEVSGTTTFNGSAAARRFGGVASSSITITEYTP